MFLRLLLDEGAVTKSTSTGDLVHPNKSNLFVSKPKSCSIRSEVNNWKCCKQISFTCCPRVVQEFRRDGSDLHISHRIGLVEALCGFQFMLTHLDGRHLVIKNPPGKVIEPGESNFKEMWVDFSVKCGDDAVVLSGSIRVVRGEGMPQYRNPFEKGDLFIKFEVQFPDNGWISTEKLTVRFLMILLIFGPLSLKYLLFILACVAMHFGIALTNILRVQSRRVQLFSQCRNV